MKDLSLIELLLAATPEASKSWGEYQKIAFQSDFSTEADHYEGKLNATLSDTSQETSRHNTISIQQKEKRIKTTEKVGRSHAKESTPKSTRKTKSSKKRAPTKNVKSSQQTQSVNSSSKSRQQPKKTTNHKKPKKILGSNRQDRK